MNIPEEKTTTFTGFTVYEAATGEPAHVADAVMQPVNGGIFAINENGDLVAIIIDSWHDTEAVTVPRQGIFVIQFGDGKYMRW